MNPECGSRVNPESKHRINVVRVCVVRTLCMIGAGTVRRVGAVCTVVVLHTYKIFIYTAFSMRKNIYIYERVLCRVA